MMYKRSREMKDQERGNVKSSGAILGKKKMSWMIQEAIDWQQVTGKQKQKLTVFLKQSDTEWITKRESQVWRGNNFNLELKSGPGTRKRTKGGGKSKDQNSKLKFQNLSES